MDDHNSTKRGVLDAPWTIGIVLLLQVVVILHACYKTTYYDLDDEMHLRLAIDNDLASVFKPRIGSTFFPVTLLSYHLDRVLFAPSGLEPLDGKDKTFAYEGGVLQIEPKYKLPENWAGRLRAMNGLYHILAAVILWLFLCRIRAGRGVALFVALAWAGHPLACESVCWISERKNVLAALFGFAALLSWTAPRRWWRWPLVWLFYLAALLSKPSALGLLPVFAILEWVDPIAHEFSWRKGHCWLQFVERLTVPVLISICAIALGMQCYRLELVDPPGGSIWTALLTDAEIFARYASNVIFPAQLSFYYGVEPILSLWNASFWGYVGLLVLLFGSLWRVSEAENRPMVLLGIVWFFGALGPVSNTVSLPYWMQDRYVYLATPGLLLAACIGVRGLFVRHKYRVGWLPAAAAAYMLVLFMLLCVRSSYFKDSDTLELDAVEREPRSASAQLCAARIHKHRMMKQQEEGDVLLAHRVKEEALLSAGHFSAALACPDLQNFEEPLSVRLSAVELLIYVNYFKAARKALDGWLPPPHLRMLKVVLKGTAGSQEMSRAKALKGYMPDTLAHAWTLRAEIGLRESSAEERKSGERLLLCESALRDAEQAISISLNDFQGHLVKARILLQMAFLSEDAGAGGSAGKYYAAAVEVLKKVPDGSPSSAQARQLLANVKPPAIAK